MLVKIIFWIINKIISILGKSVQLLISLLPESPFRFVINSEFGDFLSQINFFFPFYEILAVCQAWIIAILGYYIYSIWARWVKAIE